MLKKVLIPGVTAMLSVFVIWGCCVPPNLCSVNVTLVPQHRDWWCWAATTEMISDYYGHRIDQCQSANYIHGIPPDCCDGCTGDCQGWGSAWGASIEDIKNNWGHWQFSFSYSASSLTWTKLKETISTSQCCGHSPVQVVWWWTGGGGHVVTAYGYAEAGGEHYVAYFNPLPCDCSKKSNQCNPCPGGEDAVSTWDAFESDANHSWGNSFFSFKYLAD